MKRIKKKPHTAIESVELKDMSAKDIIWEILSWTNNGHPRKSEVPSALHFDRETKTILIDKDLLMVAIQIISPYQGNKGICKEFNCSPATAVKIMKNVKVANKDKKNPYERKVPLSWVLEMYGE